MWEFLWNFSIAFTFYVVYKRALKEAEELGKFWIIVVHGAIFLVVIIAAVKIHELSGGQF